MIILNVDNFKYGSFVDTTKHEFLDDNEVNEFIDDLKGDTADIQEQEETQGESCGKWSCRFEYKSKKHFYYMDC